MKNSKFLAWLKDPRNPLWIRAVVLLWSPVIFLVTFPIALLQRIFKV